jgi:hypothetical protein
VYLRNPKDELPVYSFGLNDLTSWAQTPDPLDYKQPDTAYTDSGAIGGAPVARKVGDA